MIRGMLSAYYKRKRYLLHFEFQEREFFSVTKIKTQTLTRKWNSYICIFFFLVFFFFERAFVFEWVFVFERVFVFEWVFGLRFRYYLISLAYTSVPLKDCNISSLVRLHILHRLERTLTRRSRSFLQDVVHSKHYQSDNIVSSYG